MRILWAALSLAAGATAVAQLQPGQIEVDRIPLPQAHDQAEYALDAPTDPARWAEEEPGLLAGRRLFGSDPP